MPVPSSVESLRIETEGEIDLRGFLGIAPEVVPGYEQLRYTVHIKGNATHTHSVTFSPAQLQQLESGVAVTVTSTADATDGHSHVVSVSCFIY